MAKIFLSYRRDDSEGFAGRIRDRLAQRFGEDAVFQDISSIPPGVDIQQFIMDAVKKCSLMLVLIDKQWLLVKDVKSGLRRLDEPSDFVRLEITAGLQQGLVVIPVLLRDTPMPSADDLPDPLKALASRNAQFIHSTSFNADVKYLIDQIGPLLTAKPFSRRRLLARIAAAGAILAVVLGAVTALPGLRAALSTGRSSSPPATQLAELTQSSIPPSSATASSTSDIALLGVASNALWTPAVREFDGVKMALVPAGCFMMGSEAGDPDEQPVNRQCFDRPFWIDVFEVTNAEFDLFAGEAGHPSNHTDPDDPREQITWLEASTFCKLRASYLPTEAEWEYAARGPDDLTYPWGNPFVRENAIWNSGQTAPVGSRPQNASWVGALDMSGNVWEWVSSWYAPYPYSATDGREASENSGKYEFRVLRGGSFANDVPLQLRAPNRASFLPVVWACPPVQPVVLARLLRME